MPAAVTPAGVRDGHPGALAGLCAARGPSVLAYCRQVAGDAEAGAAAADAFAQFRAAVVAAPALSDLDPEALLLKATRTAAASRAARSLPEACAEIPALLGARADRTIAIGDVERLEQHLRTCSTCRAPVARFKAAERAYREPPDPAMDPAVIAEIIAAMADAVPARAAPPPARAAPPPPPDPSTNGHANVAAAAPGPVPDPPASAATASANGAGTTDEPTTEFRALDAIEAPPSAAETPAASAPERAAGARRRNGRAGAVLGAVGLRTKRNDLPPPPRVDEAPADEEPRSGAERRRPRRAARVASGAGLPRAQRPAAPAARPLAARGPGQPRRAHRLPLLLPIAVVLAALLVALFVSGVVGGSDPASSPRVGVPAGPTDVPAGAEPTDVVVVPGAEEASAAEIEQAKARDRERERIQRRREDAASEAEPPAATPPAAATAPPAAATAPPPPAAAIPSRERSSDSGTGSGRRIDPGNGATGAEQIPPPKDTSTVPDLAPAPETATAP